jgi:Tol biopolymer transport system component
MLLRRFTWIILLAGLIVLAGIAALLMTPRLGSVEPSPDSTGVAAETPLKINFNRPMNAASVAAHLSIDPPVTGKTAWQGNTLIFTPGSGWPSNGKVTVELKPGAVSSLGLRLNQSLRWSFSVRGAQVAYLYPASGAASLYAIDPDGKQPAKKLSDAQGVLDFSVAPNGAAIYYSIANDSKGSDLYALDLATGASRRLLACPDAACRNPQPSPDGKYLAYELTALPGHGLPDYVQVWLLPLDGGQPVIPEGRQDGVVGASGDSTRAPAWSDNGWLAFYDANRGGYIGLQPANKNQTPVFFANATGDPGVWSPDGSSFVAAELQGQGPAATLPADRGQTAAYPSHLMLYQRSTGSRIDLSSGSELEDTDPVFSPDGRRMAFARRSLDPAHWTPGRQLWLMDAGGGRAVQISDAALYNHYAFAWSPDSSQLAYLRSNNTAFTQPPELWVLNVESGVMTQLTKGGYAPQWIP